MKGSDFMFKLGDFAFERIQMAVAENFNDEILYTLHQLADATIDITSESEEVKDVDGNLIKKIWKTKGGTFSANNAMQNVNILNAANGSELVYGTAEKMIDDMPAIEIVKPGETITLTNAADGSIKVIGAYANGANGDVCKKGTAASDTEYAYDEESKALTAPTASGDGKPTSYIVSYKKASAGLKIANHADKFPETIKLVLKALYIDPCHKDGVLSAYIVLPSFQPTPETNISIKSDAQLEYKGDLQVDYCGEEKAYYYIYFPMD